MTTTTGAYLTVSQNLPRMLNMTAAEPAVETATAYYKAKIGGVSSIKQFVGDYRLLSYGLHAYGLSQYVNDKALITKVLEGGTSNPKALANTLPNPNWRAFASAFSFAGSNKAAGAGAVSTTTKDYVEQQLESDQGAQDVGVQLALYFQRVAPTVTNEYAILGDPNLLQVVQTIFGLPPESSGTNIDTQAAALSKLVPISDLHNPTKLQQLTERFTAMYDLNYGPTSGSTSTLTFAGSGNSDATAASSILAGVITSNGQEIASALKSDMPKPMFSNSLLTSLQSFRLGG